MPVQIIRADITRLNCDAIVNATDRDHSGSGGGDLAIHQAAGEGLKKACASLPPLGVGEAQITSAFSLPCRFVIHTVGPRWRGGFPGEAAKLRRCYLNSLALAKENCCESVAFPLISAGTMGFPPDKAMNIAMSAIGEFLAETELLVYIVLYSREAYRIGERLFSDIRAYIDDQYVEEHGFFNAPSGRSDNRPGELFASGDRFEAPKCAPCSPLPAAAKSSFSSDKRRIAASRPQERHSIAADIDLKEYIDRMRDESFAEMLFRCIDERGMKDTECYKRANVDRKLFSKIRSDKNYRPGKTTALAFAVALRLDPAETEELLQKAGYALTNTNKGDVIVRYFIERKIYDVMTINEALYSFDQKLLGG